MIWAVPSTNNFLFGFPQPGQLPSVNFRCVHHMTELVDFTFHEMHEIGRSKSDIFCVICSWK